MPGRPARSSRPKTLTYWLPGATGALVAGIGTWLASGFGPTAAVLGVSAGVGVAVVGGLVARRKIASAIARRARRLDRELGDQPPGVMPARRSPEEVIDQIFARQEARVLLVREQDRVASDSTRNRQLLTTQASARELDEARTQAASARAESERYRAQEAFLVNALELPLAAATGVADMVLDGELGAEQQRLLKLARATTAASVAVIERVARPDAEEASALVSSTRSFSPRRTIVHTLRRVAPEAERRGIEVVARFTGGVPSRAEADSERLEHCVIAFVSWALSRSRSSCVTVDVGVLSPQRDAGAGLALVITVEDTGPPLDARAETLFDDVPGLALVARLLAQVGGETWVESSSFMSTRIALSYPVVRRERVTATTLYGRGSVTDKRVLVVDDQGSSRTVLSELLAGWRLLPTAVSSVSSALSALRRAAHAGEPFDIVLVDRHLGEEDGLRLVRAIVDHQELGPQRVILLDQLADLARPLPEDVRTRIAGRALKPILPEELIEVFTAVLAPQRTAAKLVPRRRLNAVSAKRVFEVLVAEDNPVDQIFVARLLEKHGHHVTLASNGADVIDCLDTTAEPFDVILMDIQMPVLDGLEATGIIRERERRAGVGHLPIIAVTAHVMRSEEQRVLDAGIDAYVPKPVEEEHLLEAIERLVPAGSGVAPRAAEGTSPADVAAIPDEPREQIFDEGKVLSFVAGDTEFLTSLVELFIQTSPKQVAAIGEAIASADPEALARSAHQLKGSVGNFGAERARQWALLLEKTGRSGSLEGADEALTRLSGEVDALRGALRELAERPA